MVNDAECYDGWVWAIYLFIHSWLFKSHSYLILKFHSRGLSIVPLGYPITLIAIHKQITNSYLSLQNQQMLKTYKRFPTALLSIMSLLIPFDVFFHEMSDLTACNRARKSQRDNVFVWKNEWKRQAVKAREWERERERERERESESNSYWEMCISRNYKYSYQYTHTYM